MTLSRTSLGSLVGMLALLAGCMGTKEELVVVAAPAAAVAVAPVPATATAVEEAPAATPEPAVVDDPSPRRPRPKTRSRPPAAAAAGGDPPPAGGVSVDVYYATDRNLVRSGEQVSYGKERAALTYGVVQVSVPPNHRVGELERPAWYKLEFSVDPDKHVALRKVLALQKAAFYERVNQSLAGDLRSFIFVHGYNVSFEDAALRTAQLAVDLDAAATPLFYSWPSQGGLAKYPIDSQNAEWTEAHLRQFLEEFADQTTSKDIVVIAHSMGSRPTTRAMASLLARRPDLLPKFTDIVLAAPDIDADVFFNDLVPAYASAGKRITLYASSNDSALKASREFNGAVRAGDSTPFPRTANGVEAIDVSDLDTDFLGHGYVAASPPMLSDLNLLIRKKMRPSERPRLEVAATPAGSTYWKFKR